MQEHTKRAPLERTPAPQGRRAGLALASGRGPHEFSAASLVPKTILRQWIWRAPSGPAESSFATMFCSEKRMGMYQDLYWKPTSPKGICHVENLEGPRTSDPHATDMHTEAWPSAPAPALAPAPQAVLAQAALLCSKLGRRSHRPPEARNVRQYVLPWSEPRKLNSIIQT